MPQNRTTDGLDDLLSNPARWIWTRFAVYLGVAALVGMVLLTGAALYTYLQTPAWLSVPGFGFLGMLIIGMVAGYIAEKVMPSDGGLPAKLLAGIAGSFAGGTLASLLNIGLFGLLGNLILAAISAVLVLWIFAELSAGIRH
jgi:uncharacterized membrane protein YeaQ/YmgE (transglycosylase-associated protein family)